MKINFLDLTFRFEQEEGTVLPELFFIHEGEIVIWTQEQKLYCQFRIEEGDYAACSYLLMSACYLLDQYDLNWKHACLTESETLVYDDEADTHFPQSFP